MASSNLDLFKENTETPAPIDTTHKLRIGIVGTGNIANSHMRAYLNMPDVEIVAGADLVPGRAEAFFARYQLDAKCYPNHQAMLDDTSLQLDAVSVCTYNRTHAECAIYALKKGIHVLLEKPLCVTLEEAMAIREAEEESGKILSVGFQPRLDENMKMIKKIVESGKLGKIYYIQTGGGRRRGIPVTNGTSFIQNDTAGIGAMGDIGCYSLDMVLNAIGYPKPLTVTGYTSKLFGSRPDYSRYVELDHPEYAQLFDVDDFAAGFIRLEGDIILDFRISWAMNMDTPGDTIILGTEGGLRIPSTNCWNGTVGGPMKIYYEVCGQQTEVEIPILKPADSLWNLKIRSFLDAIKTGGEAPVPTSQILYNQAIIDGMYRSAQLGHEITLDLP